MTPNPKAVPSPDRPGFMASKFTRRNLETGKVEVFVREAVNQDRRQKKSLQLSPRQRKKLEREQRRAAREDTNGQ